MEIRNIHKDASWFASYMDALDGGNDSQGKALVECQIKKIKQLQNLIDTIKGEIELSESPIEYNPKTILESIKALIKQQSNEIVEFKQGYFKWVG